MPYSPPSTIRLGPNSPQTPSIPDFSPLDFKIELQPEELKALLSRGNSSRIVSPAMTPKVEKNGLNLRFGDDSDEKLSCNREAEASGNSTKRARRHIRWVKEISIFVILINFFKFQSIHASPYLL
jgi:hypothetical protein